MVKQSILNWRRNVSSDKFSDRLFVGNIMECSSWRQTKNSCPLANNNNAIMEKSEIIKIFNVVKESATLVKTKKGLYVDVDDLKFWLVMEAELSWTKMSSLLKATAPVCEGETFIDENSLRPFAEVYGPVEERGIQKVKNKLLKATVDGLTC